MIRFRCQECGKKLKADENIVGRRVKCTRCDHVEKVPKSENLAKPKRPKNRLSTSKPDPARFKSEPSTSSKKTVNLDQPVELFGHSAAASPSAGSFEPNFKVVAAKKPVNVRRWFLLGLIGIFAVSVVAVVFNLGWIMDASRKFSTDYEKLEEVVYYKDCVMKLEKSRRMMEISGRVFVASRHGTDEEIKELNDYNKEIKDLTDNQELIEEVEALFRSGKDVHAKAKLVQTSRVLNNRRKEVDARAKQYTEMLK